MTDGSRRRARAASRRGPLGRLVDAVWLLLAIAGGVAVLGLLVTVVVNLLLRELAGTGIEGANDMVASWFMVTVAFTGIAIAQRHDGRIQVDFLVDALPPRMRRVVDIVVLVAVGAVGLMFAWGGLREALHQMDVGEYAAIGHRLIWPFRFVVPVGFAAFALACLLSVVESVRNVPSAAADHTVGSGPVHEARQEGMQR